VHLTESGVQPPTLNSSASALCFFFGATLDRAELARRLARAHYLRKLPRVALAAGGGASSRSSTRPGFKYTVPIAFRRTVSRRSDEPSALPADR
jgi:integrase/recombinase XerD